MKSVLASFSVAAIISLGITVAFLADESIGGQNAQPCGPGQGGQGQGGQGHGVPATQPSGHGFYLIPPFAKEKLNLTAEQKQALEELEKETKARLDKILTEEQKKILMQTRPPQPPVGGPNMGAGGSNTGNKSGHGGGTNSGGCQNGGGAGCQ